MKILQISDTHNIYLQLTNLPAADIIVHCGNFWHRFGAALNVKSAQLVDFSTCYADIGCGGRTRTCDLQVMSLASYQLLHSAIFLICGCKGMHFL